MSKVQQLFSVCSNLQCNNPFEASSVDIFGFTGFAADHSLGLFRVADDRLEDPGMS